MKPPTIPNVEGTRYFACNPAAILGFIINSQDEILLLQHPQRKGWEVVNGALDAEETPLAGMLREIREEAGNIQVKPLGVFHAYTFRYDNNVTHMISLCWVCAYEGGIVEPGDDMAGSAIRWANLDDIAGLPLLVPTEQKWLFNRAVDCYHAWQQQDVTLQVTWTDAHQNKYQQL